MQCWTSIEENLRRRPLHGDEYDEQRTPAQRLRSGHLRYAQHVRAALASETPSALLDWNNNYGENPDKAVCFHCSNLPKHFFNEVRMDFQQIIAGTVGKDKHLRDLRGPREGLPDEFRALFN